MILQNKNILLISPEPWEHVFVSKHHYALHLGKRNNRIFFLNPPSKTEAVAPTKYKNVYAVDYRGFIKGLRFYPSSIQKFFIKRKFEKLQQRCGVDFDIIWSFDNSVFFDFSALPGNVLKLCHIVDSSQYFQFGKAATTADYCFCVTDFLKRDLEKYNRNVVKINHGYAEPEYATSATCQLPGSNSLKAMYAGNLEIPYIDWDLVHTLISDNPSIDFCFAGPISDAYKRALPVSRFQNVHYLGKLEKDSLSRCLQVADVLLLVYKAEAFKEQVANSHKVMEYLASGKVLVATYTDELQSLAAAHLILMSDRNKQLPSIFSKAVQNLWEWNSQEKKQRRVQYAMENTYDKQIDRIERILSGY